VRGQLGQRRVGPGLAQHGPHPPQFAGGQCGASLRGQLVCGETIKAFVSDLNGRDVPRARGGRGCPPRCAGWRARRTSRGAYTTAGGPTRRRPTRSGHPSSTGTGTTGWWSCSAHEVPPRYWQPIIVTCACGRDHGGHRIELWGMKSVGRWTGERCGTLTVDQRCASPRR